MNKKNSFFNSFIFNVLKIIKKIRKRFNSGFSMTELMIWVAIASILGGAIAVSSVLIIDKMKVNIAKQDLTAIETAIIAYEEDYGNYPSDLSQLKTEGYVTKEKFLDPWKNEYIYILHNGGEDFTIKSLGKDKQEGGEGKKKDLIQTTLINLDE